MTPKMATFKQVSGNLRRISITAAMPFAGVLVGLGALLALMALIAILNGPNRRQWDLDSPAQPPAVYVIASLVVLWLVACLAFLLGLRLFKWAREARLQHQEDRMDPSLRSGQK